MRTGWFVLVVDVEGKGKEVHIGWKFSDDKIDMFSSSAKTCKTKMPWGCITDCKYVKLRNGRGEEGDYMMIQNRSLEKKSFKISEFNPFLWTVNEFTTCINALRTEGKLDLLALYLSLLSHSNAFTQHVEGVHTHLGFKLNGTEVTEEKLKDLGGSKDDHSRFVEMAMSCSIVVNDRKEIVEKLPDDIKKKKVSDDTPVTPKRSKAEKVSDSRREELADKNGLEKDFQKRFMGRYDIPLKNLKVSPQVSIPINIFKVKGLSKMMLENYDPSQMVLMVTPVAGLPFNKDHIEDNKFEIFHGRHRFLAVKEIEKQGRLGDLVGLETKAVTCHVMDIQSPVQANYGACRGNQTQATYTRKPYLHELIYILGATRNVYDEEHCQETVMRFGKLLSFGADDLTAVRKLGAWSKEGLSELIEVFKKYELLKTLDAKEIVKRKSSSIMEGKTVEFPATQFRLLAKVDEDYFRRMAPKVIKKEISLKDLISYFGTVSSRRQTASLVQEEFGLKSFEEVISVFPGQFEDKVLDSFAGANTSTKSKNTIGDDLRDYCHSLLENKEATPKVSLAVVDNIDSFDVASLTKYQTIVLNIKEASKSLMERLEYLKITKKQVALILLFSCQKEQVKVLDQLNLDSNSSFYKPRQICFLKEEPRAVDNYSENLIHGVVCASSVYHPPLKDFNGGIINLDHVVNQLSPPGSVTAFVNEGNLRIISIHSQYCCEYVGERASIDRFKKELSKMKAREDTEADVMEPNVGDESEVLNVADTSFENMREVPEVSKPKDIEAATVISERSPSCNSSDDDSNNELYSDNERNTKEDILNKRKDTEDSANPTKRLTLVEELDQEK